MILYCSRNSQHSVSGIACGLQILVPPFTGLTKMTKKCLGSIPDWASEVSDRPAVISGGEQQADDVPGIRLLRHILHHITQLGLQGFSPFETRPRGPVERHLLEVMVELILLEGLAVRPGDALLGMCLHKGGCWLDIEPKDDPRIRQGR